MIHKMFATLAALASFGLGMAARGQEPQAPTPQPPSATQPAPQSGVTRIQVVLPNGEKREIDIPSRGEPSPFTQDYLQALRALPPGEMYVIGVELEEIPAGLHARLGLEENVGLLVKRVIADKPAAKAGVQANDLLLKINGQAVNNPGDVVRMVNDAKGQPATLTLVREKDPFDVQVTPEQHKPGLGWRAGPVEGAPAPSFKLPPGMQFVGPGVVVPPPVAAEIQSLKEQVEALRKEHQALLEQVKQLSEQLHQQQK